MRALAEIAVRGAHLVADGGQVGLQFLDRRAGDGSDRRSSESVMLVVVAATKRPTQNHLEEAGIDGQSRRPRRGDQTEAASLEPLPFELRTRVAGLATKPSAAIRADVAVAHDAPRVDPGVGGADA